MTKGKKIEILEKAIKDYTRSSKIPLYKYFNHTSRGLCSYLRINYGIFPYNIEELYGLRPKETFGAYWFRPGAIKPRLKLLKQALNLINNEK